MPPKNERLINRLRPLGISLLIVSALCGIAASAQPSSADPIPRQTTGISSTIEYEDSLITSAAFETSAQTYHTTAHLQIPDDLPQPIMIGHARNISFNFDNINPNEVISSTNGLLWMPVFGDSLSMNILGTYGTGEHSVTITTTQPITADTPYAIIAKNVFKNSMPNKICVISLLPPWLCFTSGDPRASGEVKSTVPGILVAKDSISGNGGPNKLCSFYDNTWGGPDVNASPTSSDVYIQNNRGNMPFKKGAPLQLDVVSPTAPVTLTEDAVNMDMYATVGPPCSDIIVYTAASALDPASNTHMVLPAGTPQELSFSGAILAPGQTAERTSAGGTATSWGEQWILSPLSGAPSVALTSTMKYPCPTCLTQARLDVPGCHKVLLPVILK